MSELQVYTKNEHYTIWADTKTWTYYVQMSGGEVEAESFSTAAMAIERAVDNANKQ